MRFFHFPTGPLSVLIYVYHVAALLPHPGIFPRPHPFSLRSSLLCSETFCLTPPSVSSVLHFVPSSVSLLSAVLLANLSADAFPSIPMCLYTQLRQTALLSILHLFAMRFAASLSSLILPYPLVPDLTIAAIAALEKLSISSLPSIHNLSVSAIAVASVSQTDVIVLSPLPK